MTHLSAAERATLTPGQRRQRARAEVVRVAVAQWPPSLHSIRQRWWRRVAELVAEGLGWGLSPVEARVDAELIAYVEVTRDAEEAGIAVPVLPPITAIYSASLPAKREAA